MISIETNLQVRLVSANLNLCTAFIRFEKKNNKGIKYYILYGELKVNASKNKQGSQL